MNTFQCPDCGSLECHPETRDDNEQWVMCESCGYFFPIIDEEDS
jgi:uncharacterized protein YbaR (Trm112 family)